MFPKVNNDYDRLIVRTMKIGEIINKYPDGDSQISKPEIVHAIKEIRGALIDISKIVDDLKKNKER